VGPHNRPGGLNIEEHREIVERVLREGLVDYLNVSHGSHWNPHKIIGAMHEPTGYELAHSAPLTRLTELPRIVTGRFRTLEDAERVIEDGVADLVGMTRAHIADAEIVVKTRSGRSGEIRPCIGCNQGCVGGLASGRLGCTVNVAAGHELRLAEDRLEPAAAPKRVLVVGGGPAGMEAARIAALRGHRVTLVDAEDALGGTLRIARLAPHHAGIGDIADWLARELARLGVEVQLGTRVGRGGLRRFAPEAVVVATGASPDPNAHQRERPAVAIPGARSAHVVSARALLLARSPAPRGARALVFDDVGAYEAIGAAERLVSEGVAVTYATSHASFAPLMASALVAQPALERLRASERFHLLTRVCLVGIEADRVAVRSLDGAGDQLVPAERVVLALGHRPNRELAEAVADSGVPYRLAGDVAEPGLLPGAIAQGHRAGREL
jgi:NADPH-dependent 2,4-dienoyl-CoA reductase/sulfur reductase-like enzyme